MTDTDMDTHTPPAEPTTEPTAEADPIAAMRAAILEATLPHVAFDGWTMRALERGAADAGHEPIDAARAFPSGPIDAIAEMSRSADDAMVAAFERLDGTFPPDHERAGEEMRTRDRVEVMMRLRLQGAAADKEAVRLAATVLARPQHARLSMRLLAETVDVIWNAAGDTATDFNWYTKRGLLAAVYAPTFAYWLADRSPGARDTFGFMTRRLDGVMQVPKLMSRFGPGKSMKKLGRMLPGARLCGGRGSRIGRHRRPA